MHIFEYKKQASKLYLLFCLPDKITMISSQCPKDIPLSISCRAPSAFSD